METLLKLAFAILFSAIVSGGAATLNNDELPAVNDIQFICMKTHKASNSCHFNFKVDGAKFRFVDVGCKWGKKKDELVKKVEEGSIFLAKDWKISCPEPKGEEGL
jgi:hypothetical protein